MPILYKSKKINEFGKLLSGYYDYKNDKKWDKTVAKAKQKAKDGEATTVDMS